MSRMPRGALGGSFRRSIFTARSALVVLAVARLCHALIVGSRCALIWPNLPLAPHKHHCHLPQPEPAAEFTPRRPGRPMDVAIG